MRFRVWEPGVKREEGDVLLKFEQLGDEVRINIVDEKGNWGWDLVEFRNGSIYLAEGIGEDEYSEGLQKTDSGSIVVVS